MNIIVVGKFHTESFALHISETLEDMGHSSTRFEPGAKGRHITNKKFFYLKKIRNKALGLIANNRALRARQFAGFQNLKRFSIEKIANEYYELYENVLNGNAKK